MTADTTENVDRVCLEILADAVDRTVGTGFVHASIVKAASSMTARDYDRAGKAFQMLSPRETRKVSSAAVESANIYKDYGEYGDPIADLNPDPKLQDIRAKSARLGS
jgi:hypothetical protein